MLKALATIVGVVTTVSIQFYLMYQILERVQATELMWFLFYIYMPLVILVSLFIKLSEK